MKKNRALIIIAALSLIIAAVGINIMPDQIAAHFGFDGNADLITSKYTVFLFVGIVTAIAVIGILLRRAYEKKQNGTSDEKEAAHAASNAKICGTVTAAVCAVMLGIECIFIAMGYSGLQNMYGTEGELYSSLTVIIMGIMFAVLGNVMPKLKMNGAMGVRTTWSMKNEEVWARTQRLGGILMFFGGVVMTVAGLILRGMPALIVMAAVIVAVVVISVIGSYKYCQKWEKRENDKS